MVMKVDFSLPESKYGHLMSLVQKLTKNRIALEMIFSLGRGPQENSTVDVLVTTKVGNRSTTIVRVPAVYGDGDSKTTPLV